MIHNGAVIKDIEKSFSDYNIVEGDMVYVRAVLDHPQPSESGPSAATLAQQLAVALSGRSSSQDRKAEAEIERVRQLILHSPSVRDRLQSVVYY